MKKPLIAARHKPNENKIPHAASKNKNNTGKNQIGAVTIYQDNELQHKYLIINRMNEMINEDAIDGP